MPQRIILPLLFLLCSFHAGAERAENLLMVTYDGLRWQEVFGGIESQFLAEVAGTREVEELRRKYWAETPEARRELLMPFFWKVVAKEGQVFGDAKSGSEMLVTNKRNFSYPGYNELFSGAADPKIDSNDKIPNTNVTVLEWLNKQPGFEGRVAFAGSWDVFPSILNVERCGFPVSSGWDSSFDSLKSPRMEYLRSIEADTAHYWAGVRFDVFTQEWAVEYIKEQKPRVMCVSYGETDDWAHDRKYDMYIESARKTDEFISRIWDMLQSMPEYKEKTALIIATDHGRGSTIIDWTSHGEKQPLSDKIWMAVMGPGVPAKGIVQNQNGTQGQFAATAAALLGMDFLKENPLAAPALKLD